jgi:imidazole glycerol-phosphate synthase subunit HisF
MPSNGLCKRIIPCLDVKEGRTVKGVQFQNLQDLGDPIDMAALYQKQGADELVFLDISATTEGRATMAETVSRIATVLMIPFTVGGGIRVLSDVKRLMEAGADKVSVNTAAVERPELIRDIAEHYGNQCCVLAIDAKWSDALRSWEVVTHSGKHATGMRVLDWAQQAVSLGAGEILLTSWDKDGSQEGFDLALTRAVAEAVSVPVIASGGARDAQSFMDVFTHGKADAALAAGIFHRQQVNISDLKQACYQHGIQVRPQ